MAYDLKPRRFRIPVEQGKLHPNGSNNTHLYGCYFPQTDLTIVEMGNRGTGIPTNQGIEWIDDISDLPWAPENVKKNGA